MGTAYIASILFLLGTIAASVAACVVIYSRKIRQLRAKVEAERKQLEEKVHQTQAALQQAEEAKSKAEAESERQEEELRQAQMAFQQAEEGKTKAEAESKRFEEDLRRTQAELQQAEEERSKAEAESKQLEEKIPRAQATGQMSNKQCPEAFPNEIYGKKQGRQLSAKEGKDEAEPKTGGKRIEPVDRGGGPRGPSPTPKKDPTQKQPLRQLKAEIVCLKRERQWIPAIEVSEEILDANPNVEVIQNDLPLTRDESTESCWCLKEARGQVVVQWNDGETQIALGEKDYLLFKLGSENEKQGRFVRDPSVGAYLVMVPNNWERDEELSGHPPASPETVSVNGYKAHFFNLEKGSGRKIAFHTSGGKSFSIESRASQFELVGTRLNDAAEGIGPLFGNGPPLIRAVAPHVWQNIETIVVGVEGSGKKKWRTEFNPEPSELECSLPSQVAARKGGWYFLRFYDKMDDLVESLDFRFLCGLKAIKIQQLSPVPSEDGHKPVLVEFLYESGYIVSAADAPARSIPIETEHDKATVTIPRDANLDETHWLVEQDDGPQERVAVLVERVWWGIGEESKQPSQWIDQPLILQRDNFAARSNKALWLRLPGQRWAEKALLGFEQPKARPYNPKAMENTVAIPLRDFGDTPELQHIGTTPLRFWIHTQGVTHTGTCGTLTVKAYCKQCDFPASAEEDIFDHIDSSHIDEFFWPVTWEEMRKLIPSLPEQIYKCSYCDFYAETGPLKNPTSTIIEHCNQRHSQVSFRIVTNVDEIREHHSKFKNLPRYQKCSICGSTLDVAHDDKRKHLFPNHRKAFYELR